MYIGLQRYTTIHIAAPSVHPSVPPSLYPFFPRNCWSILNKDFRSTAKHPSQEVGQSDVDPQELQEVIRTSFKKSLNFNNVTSNQVFRFFHSLYNHTSPEAENRLVSIIRNSLIFKNGKR